MRYKIEIWQYRIIASKYESDDISDVLLWYQLNWQHTYDMGYCSFDVYEDGRELSFEEEYELGFYN